MQLDDEATASAIRRLRRVEGQVAGVIRMLESGRECQDIVTQLAAASRALDKAGFQMIANGLRQCMSEPGQMKTQEELEKLFMSLA